MAVTFPGRVEALLSVPSGGSAGSASIGSRTAAATITVPEDEYFWTAAGGVSSFLTTWQALLNSSLLSIPDNAAALQAAIGYGTWSGGQGWLCQEASGNLAPSFGATALTATSLTYQNAGITTGDYAIGFDAGTDKADGGDIFDPAAGEDLVVAWVGKFTNTSVVSSGLFSKWLAGSPRWVVWLNGSGKVEIIVSDNVNQATATTANAVPTDAWHVGIAVLDRGANQVRVGIRTLSGTADVASAASTATVGALTSATAFRVGELAAAAVPAATNFLLSALYVSSGASVAASMSANLSTALSNFATAVNGSWSAALSTTDGRITLSHSSWPISYSFTDTTARDVMGFAGNVDYPQTAAQVTAALGGYGDFTSGAGYLCNESSGNLAAAFGTPATLTASSLTYSNQGARGGSDKAIGFDAGTDYADGGDVFDVGANDLIVAYVGYWSTTPSAAETITSKLAAAYASGWAVYGESSVPATGLFFKDGVSGHNVTITGSSAFCTKEWHVGIAVIDRSTGMARFGTRGLRSGGTTVSAETAVSGSVTTAATLRIGADLAQVAPQNFKLSALYIATGSGVATGLSANLSTALSSFAAYMKSQTSTKQARGLWFPECPLTIAGDPDQAPKVTDARSTMSPSRSVITYVGNSGYRHKGVMWTHVPKERTWESAVTYANASWEYFANECLLGLGSSWFTPSSDLQIYYDKAGVQTAVGYTYNSSAGIPGWRVANFRSIEPTKSVEGWTGLWRIELGDIESDG